MKRRGFSLFEVSLAVGLGALLITLMAVLGPGLIRTWRRCDLQSEVQRAALISLKQIRFELAQGYAPSLQCPTSAQLAFASRLDAYGVQQYAPTGEPYWEKWVSYRWDASSGQLMRRYDIWPQPETRVVSLQYAPTAVVQQRKVCDHVSQFAVQTLATGQLQMSITVKREGEQASLQSTLSGLGEESD